MEAYSTQRMDAGGIVPDHVGMYDAPACDLGPQSSASEVKDHGRRGKPKESNLYWAAHLIQAVTGPRCRERA